MTTTRLPRTVEINLPVGTSGRTPKVPADLAIGDVIGVSTVCGRTSYTVIRAAFRGVVGPRGATGATQYIVGRATSGVERWFTAVNSVHSLTTDQQLALDDAAEYRREQGA